MNILPIKDCKLDLCFQNKKTHNPFTISFESYLLNNFNQTNLYSINYTKKDLSFLDLFKRTHPELSILEMAKLMEVCDSEAFQFSWESFFKTYQMKYREEYKELLKILLQSPLSFQEWVHSKKIHFKDIEILSEISKIKDFTYVLEWIGTKHLNHSISHSEGVKILEFSGDLHLLNKSITSLFTEEKPSSLLIQDLYALRYPNANKKEKMLSKKIEEMNLPENIEAKLMRKNDKLGLNIQIKAFSLKELEQKIKS